MAKKIMSNFQKNLAALCKGKQEFVAGRAGITRVHLNRIIKGHACPSLDLAHDIAKALGVPLGYLIGEKEQHPTHA